MKYTEELKKRSIEYGSLPFWSWNDRLEPERLKAQIKDMHELGMNGFFMHARSGLETEYLSDEWYDAIKVCIEEAKKYGMQPWAYDENGWPSGFSGGKLLDDPYNHAKFIKYEYKDSFDENALAVYVIEKGKSRRVTGPEEGVREYFTIYKHSDTSYVDTLNDVVTKKFIASTHEDYKSRLGDDFGKEMPGFFTDEPQYFRYATVWSDILPERFSEKYGYDIFSALDAMFVDFEGAEIFRYDYWHLCHELFINNFVKTIYDWCSENGCMLTGHGVEEASLSGQMWCCGGIMPFYEYEHIPGMDHLGRGYDRGIASKQLGSVSAQLGKKKVMSEMFACCGWDVLPGELKKIAESQYVAGVNIMCQHLYPYSERGQRKRDYPAHYSQHLPWQKQMKHFDEYFNRLGYTLSRGQEIAPVLVIHPVHSCWLNYKREQDAASVAELEEALSKLTDELYDKHICFHFGDEDIIARHGSVSEDRFTVGLHTYSCVIIPRSYSLDRSTVSLLRKYVEGGGRMLVWDERPERIDGRISKEELSFINSNTDMETLAEESDLRISQTPRDLRAMLRQTERGRVGYVVNLSDKPVTDLRIGLRGAKHINLLDLETGTFRKISSTSCSKCGALRTALDLEPGESVVITEFEGEEELPPEEKGERISFEKPFRLSEVPENMMPLQFCRISYDGINFEEARPIQLVRDILYRSRYKGDLWLRYDFNVKNIPEKISLAAEPVRILDLSVNGISKTPDGKGWFDPSFLTYDILSCLKTGENNITVKVDYFQRDYVYYVLYGGVSESLRNCLLFDTELETVYLYGKFGVDTSEGTFTPGDKNTLRYDGPLYITGPETDVDMGNITASGYPFFAGPMDFENEIDYKPGDPSELYLEGRFAVAEISVGDSPAKIMMFKRHINLADSLKEGKNRIRVRLVTSNRNLMGPHHNTDPEPYFVGPVNFSYEKCWSEDEKCPFFVEGYNLVKFGAESD